MDHDSHCCDACHSVTTVMLSAEAARARRGRSAALVVPPHPTPCPDDGANYKLRNPRAAASLAALARIPLS
jgi:hypothetical protein